MKINDLVTRYSHNHDVIFRVVSIFDGVAILKGEVVRLICDAELSDLKSFECNDKIEVKIPCLNNHRNEEYIYGTILHLDGDEYYLKKAMEVYKQYQIKAIGYYVKEDNMKNVIKELLLKHHPDILVLTGHDSLKTNSKDRIMDLTSYKNSVNFVDAVLKARELISDKDSLIIIAGACQSYYEEIIKAGANFASSPERKNIHLLDPVIVASLVAYERINEYVDVNEVLNSTISREMGGLDTRGKARKMFLGGKRNDDG